MPWRQFLVEQGFRDHGVDADADVDDVGDAEGHRYRGQGVSIVPREPGPGARKLITLCSALKKALRNADC